LCNLSYSNRNRRLERNRPRRVLKTVARVRIRGSAGQGGSVTMGARTTVRHRLDKGTIQPMKVTGLAAAAIAAAISLSAPAYADPDTDFDNQLGRFGIYGPHDYNPYLAKIACHPLGGGGGSGAGGPPPAFSLSPPRGTTQVQTYQFLGSAIAQYCPDLQGKLQHIPGT